VSYPGTREWVTFYVETPDITATLADVERLGGRVVLPRTVMPDVTLGIFEDAEGHTIGLVEARTA
jgi:predicted enzyme related to lactoylglutathione lyase